MMSVREVVQNNMYWKVGLGKVSFWYDNWSSVSPLWLKVLKRGAALTGLVVDFRTPSGWDSEKN